MGWEHGTAGDENTCRLDFAPSEAVAYKRAMLPVAKAEAKKRQDIGRKSGGRGKKKLGGKLPPSKSRDVVAVATGMSEKSIRDAEKVVQAAEADPSLLSIVETMDKTGNRRKMGNIRGEGD